MKTNKIPPLLDVDKFARFSSRTIDADKFYKTIGYGLGAVGHLMAHTMQKETETSKGFQAIASNISMARYVIRFTGGVESFAAWKNDSWCYGDDSEHIKQVVRLQALSMIIYYPLEHISYIGFVAPKLLDIDAMKVSRQSCQAWGIYIILDVYANAIRFLTLTSKEKQIKEQMDLSDEERATLLTSIQLRRRELYYVQLRNFLFAGPCFHWSFQKSFLPEHLIYFDMIRIDVAM
ncbi:hypothetical protein PHYSODRAFT_561237 [Plasmopara halstedii]|uniref:Peroxisomal biogenesis factor 11 n=1 Tax=Plasmopara halstedii TaxID=4781 RepID=A0A0P1B951_PLAHL|nr:hypothetical protein PHYSODRAFT_561237 [Plasmopara halstedii]CEG50509.1 hypothetical protein PHYSODRAFT_561237 [Plasmopara halstedii]|eukprot:XP_024586878.1 hypothetical protein PHYSODRAFT_561237 [Plasmopara halstedii]